MTDFFQSQFIEDLQEGKLPPVEIKVPTQVYAFTGLTIVLSALVILIVYNYLKK
ncbi:hypothetical protein ACRTDU_03880 [Sunxiuqinia elliptica]